MARNKQIKSIDKQISQDSLSGTSSWSHLFLIAFNSFFIVVLSCSNSISSSTSPASFDSENGVPELGNTESSSQTSDLKVAIEPFFSSLIYTFYYPFVVTIANSKLDLVAQNVIPYFLLLL